MAVINLTAPTPNAYEKTLNQQGQTVGKPGVIRVNVDTAPTNPLTITLTKTGSAVSGVDYNAIPATVTIPAGQKSIDVQVMPVVRSGFLGLRTVTLTAQPAGGYTVGTAATVTIRVIEHSPYGGIVGARPTSINRFVAGDGMHGITDPATGPVGQYRLGMIGKRVVVVDPLGWAMGSLRGHFFVGPSVTKVFLDAAGARFGTAATQGATNKPVCDFILKAETRSGFNYLGGGHSLVANPIMSGNQPISALIPAQAPGSIDKKPAVIYLSHQRETMRYYQCKNIVGRPPQGGETISTQQTAIPGYPTASKKNSLGACYLPDVFDDPAQVPGAPGTYNSACNGAASGGLIRHTQDFPTWDTSPSGPEYAPLTTPWWIIVHFDERDFCNGMGEYHRHVGYACLTCQPKVEQYNVVGTIVKPSDQTVYSKIKAREFLRSKYGNDIAKLNAAWGSNYTTFDSAGGYGTGTGLYDENGQKPWFGNDGVRLSDAKEQVRLDLDELEDLYWEQLWSVLAKGLSDGHRNRLKATHAGTLDSKWSCTRAAAKYMDLMGNEKDFAADHPLGQGYGYDAPATTQTLTLAYPQGSAVKMTGAFTLVSPNSSIRGRCIAETKQGGGFGIVQQFVNTSTLIVEIIKPFTTTTLDPGSYRWGTHSESVWMKWRRPCWAWVAFLSGPDSYFGSWSGQGKFLGNPGYNPTKYYLPDGDANTQAERAAIYRKRLLDGFNRVSHDGYKFDVGIEMWEAVDRVAETTQFGIVSADCKMYDGKDRSQNGDFFTPALAVADEMDYAVLLEAAGQDVPVPDTGGIAGTVADTGSIPMQGAAVTAAGFSTQTDPAGAYSLTGIPVGNQAVTANKVGFDPSTKTVAVGKNQVATVDFSLTPAEPEEPMFKVGDKVKTDSQPHNLRATPDGNAPPIASIPGNSPGKVIDPGEVPDKGRPGQTQTNVDFGTLGKGYMSTPNLILVESGGGGTPTTGTISGTVSTATSAARVDKAMPLPEQYGTLAGAEVKVSDTQKTTTDSSGKYTLPNLPAGSYTVTATAQGHEPGTAPATVAGGQTCAVDIALTATPVEPPDDELEPRVSALEKEVAALKEWRAKIKEVS